MITLFHIALVIFSFVLMEGIAWLTHKYVMHGLLWSLHRDHHNHGKGFFQRNDFFFLIFAIPGWLFTMFGAMAVYDWKFFIGIGITLYGLAYFLVHEIFIHQRIKAFRKIHSRYADAVKRAHYAHHKHLGKENGESFGMLWVHPKYFRP